MINKFIFRNFVPACMVACAVVMGVMAPCNSFAQKAKAQKKAKTETAIEIGRAHV